MALKDKLGLALIPSAYSGVADENNAGGTLGKVHSVFPKQTLSDNLVSNDIFLTDWTSAGADSITQNGFHTNGSGTGMYFSLNVNKLYRVRVNNLVGDASIRYRESNSGAGTIAGDADEFFYVNTYSSTNPNIYIRGNSETNVSVDSISVQLVSNGDFDFSRGSDATRVNKDGYIESVQVLSDELVQNGDFEEIGSELVTNGTFDTDLSNWFTLAGSPSVLDGKLFLGNGGRVAQSNVIDTSKNYIGTIEVSERTQGFVSFYIGGSDLINIGSNGTHQHFVATPFNSTIYIYADSNFDGKIDNISVKEVGENWTFDSSGNWSFEDNKAVYNDLAVDKVYQSISLTQDNKYRLKFTVSDASTNASLWIGNNAGSVNYLGGTYVDYANGTYELDFVMPSNQTTLAFYGNTTGSSFKLDNISLKEITDDTDIPRLDYSDGACPTLLLEPQRTNEIANSKNLSEELTGNRMDINDAVDTSPEGIVNASKLIPSTDANNTHQSDTSLIGSFSSGDKVTISMFAKADGFDGIFLRFTNGSAAFTTNKIAKFDLSRGRWNNDSMDGTTGNMVGEVGMEDYGNGWYRCFATATTDASGTVDVRIAVADVTAQDTYNDVFAGDNTSGVLIYGLQVEQGGYPTSYIPTHGSTVTRLADVCNNAGDSTIFNDDEGVLFVDMAALADDLTFRTVSISDGTTDNRINIRYRTTSNAINGLISGNGSTAFNNNHITQDITEYSKVALKYKSGDIALWVDGVEVLSSTASFNISGLNQISFNRGSSIDLLYGKVKSLLYFDRALTDEELEALTSSRTSDILNDYSTLLSRVGATYESTGLEDELNKTF
jgi:hypothetical protein